MAATALAQRAGVDFYARFLGRVPPLLAVVLAAALGAPLLALLASRGVFAIRRRGDLRGPIVAAGLAAAFGLLIVAADGIIVFPRDLNAPLPGALLFYPSIAFLVEILFHVLPLAALVALASALGPERRERAIVICLVIVAFLEPTFQATLGGPRHPSPWVPVFVWGHVAAINLAQLAVFRRYDFVSMLSLRLVYYLLWHVAWGYLRLRVLF